MRTKTLLLTAALGAAGIATSMAQVYSVNAVGYVNVTIPLAAGKPSTFAILANPLNGTNNQNLIGSIIPDPPALTRVYVFRGHPTPDYITAQYVGGGQWLPPDLELPPGEGFFIEIDAAAPNPTTLTFVGEVPQGSLSNNIPVGFSMRASQVPQSAGVSSVLGLTPTTVGDKIYMFDVVAQDYVTYQYTGIPGTEWLPVEPVPAVAQGFFYENTGASALPWTRSFSVNP